jgi:uncharacterized membrane protein YebE (DUF533 family)
MTNIRGLLDQVMQQAQGTTGLGGGQTPQGQGAAGQPSQGFDLDSLLSGKKGLATGAIAGGLAGLLLGGKKPRKLAKSALKVGGAALVGGLAYKAWQDWQANKTASPTPATPAAPVQLPSPEGTPFMPDEAAAQEELSRDLIRAMIAAAKADGVVTEEEKQRMTSQLEALALDAEDHQFIQQELSAPLDVSAIATTGTTPERAAEIYAASLLAIDPSGAAEKGYLAMLAARMNLDEQLVAHLHATADTLVDG